MAAVKQHKYRGFGKEACLWHRTYDKSTGETSEWQKCTPGAQKKFEAKYAEERVAKKAKKKKAKK